MSSSYRKILMASGAGESAWFSFYEATTTAYDVIHDLNLAIKVDSEDNIITMHTITGGSYGSAPIVVRSVDSDGNKIWENRYQNTSSTTKFKQVGIAINPTNDNITVLTEYNERTINLFILSASTGALQFNVRKQLKNNGGNNFITRWSDIESDASGNLYGGAKSSVNGANIGETYIKFSSSGTQLAVRRNAGMNFTAEALAVDSQSNFYQVGWLEPTGVNRKYGVVAKFNSSGVMQWQKRVQGSALNASSVCQFFSVCVDDQNNVIVGGYTSYAANTLARVTKFNSSGTHQWTNDTQSTANPGSTFQYFSVAADSDGNIFATGELHSTGSNRNGAPVAKYSSSGTLEYCNNFRTSTSGINAVAGNRIRVDSNKQPILIAQTLYTAGGASPSSHFVAKLPKNGGAVPNTYSTVTYEAGGVTGSSVTPTITTLSSTTDQLDFTDELSQITRTRTSVNLPYDFLEIA